MCLARGATLGKCPPAIHRNNTLPECISMMDNLVSWKRTDAEICSTIARHVKTVFRLRYSANINWIADWFMGNIYFYSNAMHRKHRTSDSTDRSRRHLIDWIAFFFFFVRSFAHFIYSSRSPNSDRERERELFDRIVFRNVNLID